MSSLLHMLPRMAKNDLGNTSSLNAKLCCKANSRLGSIGVVQLPNVSNIVLGENGVGVLLSSWSSVWRTLASAHASSLCNHVLGIVLNSSKKQVVRISAFGVIAVMADKQPFWDGTIMDLPRYSMRSKRFAPPLDIHRDLAVSISGFGRRPSPAAIGHNDVSPKSLNQIWKFAQSHYLPTMRGAAQCQ